MPRGLASAKQSCERCKPGLSVSCIEEEYQCTARMQRSSSSVFSSPITRKLPDAFTDHNAPEFVRKLFIRWVEQADAADNGIITINRYDPHLPYSHTTVDKATRWLVSHHLLMKVEVGRGRGKGSRYFVRWSLCYKNLQTRQKAVNLKNGNLAPSIRSIRRKARKEEPLLESNADSRGAVYSLTRWVKDAPADSWPSEREKRKLSAAVRLLIPSSRIVDTLLAGLWWRKRAPLRLWRDTIAAVWQGVSIPEAVSDKELIWRVRRGLKDLLNTGDRKAFKATLEAPPPSPSQEEVEGKLKRVTARLKGIREKYPEWKAEAVRTGVCPTCGEPVTQYEIEEGFHACARWWNYLEEDLIREREALKEELDRIRVDEEIKMLQNAMNQSYVPTTELVGTGSR